MLIPPTVGRKLWFFTSALHAHNCVRDLDQPFDATVLFVHGDRCINVKVTDHHGKEIFVSGAVLVQEDDVPNGPHCQWMPYQAKQAEKNLAETTDHVLVPKVDYERLRGDAPEPLGDTTFLTTPGKDAATLIGEALREPEAPLTVSEFSDKADNISATESAPAAAPSDIGAPL